MRARKSQEYLVDMVVINPYNTNYRDQIFLRFARAHERNKVVSSAAENALYDPHLPIFETAQSGRFNVHVTIH